MSFLVPNPGIAENTRKVPTALTASAGGLISAQVDPGNAGGAELAHSAPGVSSAFLTATAGATAQLVNSSQGGFASGKISADNNDTGIVRAGPGYGAFAQGYVKGGGDIRAIANGSAAFGSMYRSGYAAYSFIQAAQEGSIAFGCIENNAAAGYAFISTYGPGGKGSLCGGHVIVDGGGADIQCVGGGSFAGGYSKSVGGSGNFAQIIPFYEGSMAFGFCYASGASGANYSSIIVQSYGALAFGYAGHRADISAYGRGSFATGSANNANATGQSSIRATGHGSFARGIARLGFDITATALGSCAMGAAYGANILASGVGSFAAGYASSSTITAAANNAFQFGQGTNSVADTVKIGTAGLRFKMTTGLPATPADGDFGIDGGGNVLVRSAATTITLSHPTITGSRGGNAALASLLTSLATMGLIADGTSA